MTTITAQVKLPDSLAKTIKWFTGLQVIGAATVDGKEVFFCRPVRKG